MKKRTKFVVYVSGSFNQTFVTTLENEKEFLRLRKAEEYDMENEFDRKEFISDCVEIDSMIHIN